MRCVHNNRNQSIPQLPKKMSQEVQDIDMHPLNCWIEVKKIQYWNRLPCPQQQKLKSWEAASIYHSLQSNSNRNWVEGLKPQEREAPRKKKRGEGKNKSWRNSSSNICPSTQVHSQYLLNPDALRRCSMIVYNQANHVEHKTGSLKRSTKEKIVENKCTGKARQHYVP